MRIFGSERMDKMLQTLGLKEDEAIVHPWINKALEKAQQKVEARNFDIRKNLLKFDNVMNDQRKVIFEQRIGIMRGEDISETIDDMRHQVIDDLVSKHIPENAYAEQWDAAGLRERLREAVAIDFPVDEWAKEEGIADEEIRERVTKAADQLYADKREQISRPRSCSRSRRRCSCRRSTISGASISSPSNICARSSTCAATASATRSTNTRPKASICSRR